MTNRNGKRFDLVSRKISLLYFISKPAAPGFWQSCFKRYLTNFRVVSGQFLAFTHFSGSGRVWAYAFGFEPIRVSQFTILLYKHLKEIYVICILIEITS